ALANAPDEKPKDKPVVVVPEQSFSYPDRHRVFYRVVSGDTVRAIASVFGVTADEVSRWNVLDPGAAIHDGMVLQIYAPVTKKLAPPSLAILIANYLQSYFS